jgi:hypothetical protein
MSLIAHYKLDDLNDYSGNNNHLIYYNNSGGLVSNLGKNGNAYKRSIVNNGSDYLRSSNKVNLKNEYTMSC